MACIAHELRNPLTIIRGSAELLSRISHTILGEGMQDGAFNLLSRERKHCHRDKESPGEGKENAAGCIDLLRECEKYGLEMAELSQVKQLASLIENASNRMENILGAFLRLAKEIKKEPVLLLGLIQACRKNVKLQYPKADISIQSGISNPIIHGDRELLEIAIFNLLENGIKYSENFKIEIDIHQKNGWIQINIQDHGIGISPKDLPFIFDPFYRVDRKIKGLGLGLFIAKEMIEKNQGAIEVQSQLGIGTRFTISHEYN